MKACVWCGKRNKHLLRVDPYLFSKSHQTEIRVKSEKGKTHLLGIRMCKLCREKLKYDIR